MMMLAPSYKKFRTILLLLAAFFFLWTATLGPLYHMGEMNLDGTMNGCLFDGQTEACTMDLSEHVSFWQSLLRSLPQNSVSLAVLGIFAMVVFALWQRALFEFGERVAFYGRLYIKQHPHMRLFYALREIFSQGILNAKVYASVSI